MDVPTSDVGYTPAMPWREDREIHKWHVVALGEIYIYIYVCNLVCFLLAILGRRKNKPLSSSSSSNPFSLCAPYDIYEDLPLTAFSSYPLDLVPRSSCASCLTLYCPSPRSLQPTSSSVSLTIPIQCSFLCCSCFCT